MATFLERLFSDIYWFYTFNGPSYFVYRPSYYLFHYLLSSVSILYRSKTIVLQCYFCQCVLFSNRNTSNNESDLELKTSLNTNFLQVPSIGRRKWMPKPIIFIFDLNWKQRTRLNVTECGPGIHDEEWALWNSLSKMIQSNNFN